MTYWQIYRPWLIKLINERMYLSRKGFRPYLLPTAKELFTLVHYHGYKTDAKLASFILRRKNEILSLIPLNQAYEKQYQTLNLAIQQAESFALSNP